MYSGLFLLLSAVVCVLAAPAEHAPSLPENTSVPLKLLGQDSGLNGEDSVLLSRVKRTFSKQPVCNTCGGNYPSYGQYPSYGGQSGGQPNIAIAVANSGGLGGGGGGRHPGGCSTCK